MRDIEVNFNIDPVEKAVELAASRAVRSLAMLVSEEAQMNITINDQIDTGAMKASVFVEAEGLNIDTREQSISQATAAAAIPGKKTGKAFPFEPANEEWNPDGPLEAKVGVSAEYGYDQEYLREDDLSFFRPALEEVNKRVDEVVTRVFKDAGL